MVIEYLQEWTLLAWAGRFLVALAFASAVAAVISFSQGWNEWGKRAFQLHAVSTFAVIALVFVLFGFHRYEFQYIWKHLNNAMPMRFILSAFWGGQEGGFLLWMFWHNVLGLILLRKKTKWTAVTMATLSGIQVFLTSMILGIYFGDFQLGLDPFLLLRDAPQYAGLPWTLRADYLTAFPLFQDGQGLNPLLQNYWMTIHPPTLFLGFAATSVPFAYAIAGLTNRTDNSWMRPALRWSFFTIGILGTGILMGGAWAYEALSFGGFWAWDPVENSSLVPWIMSVAGGHLLLINRNRKKPLALFTTYYFLILSFLLVLYSTFLTKSGILGDTSVHSFVDSGILPQLLVYLLTFVTLGHIMLLRPGKWRRWTLFAIFTLALACFKGYAIETLTLFLLLMATIGIKAYRTDIERTEGEDSVWSRDFWMFVGALLLLVSAAHITWQTSLPVFNHFLEPWSGTLASLGESWNSDLLRDLSEHNLAPGTDFDQTYHLVQVPLAVLIMLGIGFAQWLKYKHTNIGNVLRKIFLPILVSMLLTGILLWQFSFEWWEVPRVALLFAALFAVASNADYIIQLGKGKWRQIGSPLAHVGFGLVIFGAVLSTSQKNIISKNQIGDISTLNEELNNREDLLIMEGDTLNIGEYFVSYRDRYTEGIHVKFRMDYFDKEPRVYEPGEVVFFDGMVFEALEDHEASEQFTDDMEDHWMFIPFPNERQAKTARIWESGVPGEKQFTLEPRIQLNEQMGNAPEPDTRHWLHRDLYTHIKWGRVTPPETDEEGWMGGRSHTLQVGDSMLIGHTLLTIDSLRAIEDSEKPNRGLLTKDLAIAACVQLKNKEIRSQHEPLYIVRDSLVVPDMFEADDYGIKMRIETFNPQEETLEMTIWEHISVRRDFVVMQAVLFPLINVLWLGCIIMAIGSGMAVYARWKRDNKSTAPKSSGLNDE
jgi:cytochrome c-type biogenesis protein CcmF